MPSLLTQKLADHLNLSEEEADRQLTDFVAQIKEQLDTQGQAVIPGLGTFRASDKGLVFEPDDALARAVNHRFVGLEPVQVDVAQEVPDYGKNELFPSDEPNGKEPAMPSEPAPAEADDAPPALPPDAPLTAAEEPSSPVPEEEREEAVPPDEAEDEHAEPDADAPPQQEAAPDHPAGEDQPGEAAADDAAAAHAAELAAQASPSEEAGEEASPPSSDAEDSASPEDSRPTVNEAASGGTPRRPSRQPDTDRTRKTAWLWIVVLLVLILGAGGLWYVFRPAPQTESLSSPPPVTQEEQPATSPSEGGTEAAPAPTPPSPDETAGSANSPASGAPDALDPSAGGWTIVLASATSREEAEATLRRYAERLRGEDLAFGIMESEVEGTTRFRVGAGQFTSTEEARATMSRLADALPEGAWLLQIEPDGQTN